MFVKEWNGLELGKMIGVLLTSGGGWVASLPSLENSTGCVALVVWLTFFLVVFGWVSLAVVVEYA